MQEKISDGLHFGLDAIVHTSKEEMITLEEGIRLGRALGEKGAVAIGSCGASATRLLANAVECGVSAAGGQAVLHDARFAAQAGWLCQRYGFARSVFFEEKGTNLSLYLFEGDGLLLSGQAQQTLREKILQDVQTRDTLSCAKPAIQMQQKQEDYLRQAATCMAMRALRSHRVTVAVAEDTVINRTLKRALALMGIKILPQWQKGICAFSASGGGLRLCAQDETGAAIDGGQLLTLLTLIEMEYGARVVAVRDEMTAGLELVAQGFDGQVLRLEKDGAKARKLAATMPQMHDAIFAAARICACMQATGESLSGMLRKIPRLSVWKENVPMHKNWQHTLAQVSARYGKGGGYAGGTLRFRTRNGWVQLQPQHQRGRIAVMVEGQDLELAAELCHFLARDMTKGHEIGEDDKYDGAK